MSYLDIFMIPTEPRSLELEAGMFEITREGFKARISNKRIYIGRGPHSNITFSDDTVSNWHAFLIYKNGVLRVEDLESLNGTYVCGEEVHGEEREIVEGASLRFGPNYQNSLSLYTLRS
jgi:pSer/pThr/pTyr-binding forkhead associated (FHA) protein